MILFYDDWKKYPNAIIHTDTKNESWVRLAMLLKRMGVKNHAFMLALHNPKLRNVDPHDPNLSYEYKKMVLIECLENPWYYFREVALVPPTAGNARIHLRANRANISMLWLFFNHITTYLIQPRQTGKSLSIEELIAGLGNLFMNNTTFGILTKDDKLRDKTSKKIRDIIDKLPPYLKNMDKRDVRNMEKITIKKLNNVISLFVGNKDPKAADNVGRGMTMPVTVIDEFAYVNNIQIILPVMLAATTAAREEAAKQGTYYGTILTTTPGKLNTPEGRYAYNVYQGSLRWSETFFDCKNVDELNKILENNSRSTDGKKKFKVMLLEYNHRQLGYTDEWLLNRIETALSDGEDAESDFLNKWVGGTLKSPIDKKYIEIMQKSIIKEPIVKTYKGGYVVRWYITEEMMYEYARKGYFVIGVDPSEAVGKDDIGLVVRYSQDGRVIAAGTYNETNLTVFSEFLLDLLKYIPNSIMIIERRNSGTGIIDDLLKLMYAENINPFKRLFNWVINDYKKYKDKYPDIVSNVVSWDTIEDLRKHFGFATSASGRASRGELYGNIFNASIKYTSNKIHDEILVNQLLDLEVKNGRIDHPKDGHDDMVISWLLGYWFMTRAENKKLYGIDDTYTLKKIIDNEILANASKKDLEYIKQQERIKNEIDNLLNRLRNEKDIYIASKLIRRIKVLEKKLDTEAFKNINIDDAIREIKIYKKLKKLNMVQ